MVLALRMQAAVEAFYDWPGGLIWLRMERRSRSRAAAPAGRSHGGGHATLMRASPRCRAAAAGVRAAGAGTRRAVGRLKEQFDPQGILNPGGW